MFDHKDKNYNQHHFYIKIVETNINLNNLIIYKLILSHICQSLIKIQAFYLKILKYE